MSSLLNLRRIPSRRARLKKKQNIRFLSFFCPVTVVCLLYAEPPHAGAVEVTVSHRSRISAFIELTLVYKPVSRRTANTIVNLQSIQFQ